MEDQPGDSGFLPPEPPGPEPELTSDQPQAPGAEPGPAPGAAQQPPQHTPGWPPPPPPSQPPPGWQYPPPGQPGYPPGQAWGQAGWQAPPPGYPPAPPGGVAWSYAQPKAPDNGSAVAGFSLSLSGSGLLLITVGFSSIVSIACCALGIFYSKRGRERVDRGETAKHRGLAQAGYVIGIVGTVLSVLATAGWIAFFVLYATNDDFRHNVDNSGNSNALMVLGRLVGLALS